MKKHLIAAAVAAAVAVPAAAQVTVYGIMDVSISDVDNETRTAAGAVTTADRASTGNGDGALSTSRLGFRGVEDLGGGLKANFVLEYDLVDVGTGGLASAARYSYVGLQGGFGTIRLGRQEQSIHSIVTGYSAGYANNMPGALYSNGSGDALSTNAASVRPHSIWTDRAITFISPSFSGFTVELQGASASTDTGVANGNTESDVLGGSLKFSSGPFSIGVSMMNIETQTPVGVGLAALPAAGGNVTTAAVAATDTDRTEQALGASYDMGVARLFGLYTVSETENALTGAKTIDRDAFEIGARIPFGSGLEAWVSTFSGGEDATPALSQDHEGWQIGIKKDLSKRTSLYGIYGSQEREGNGANAGNNIETDGIAFGIRHSF